MSAVIIFTLHHPHMEHTPQTLGECLSNEETDWPSFPPSLPISALKSTRAFVKHPQCA